MPFNVVNKQGEHLGVLLKKQNIVDDLLKIKDKNYYVVALTDTRIEDLCSLTELKKVWAAKCKLLDSNGLYNDSKLCENILKKAKVYLKSQFSYEEALRLLHLKFEWNYTVKRIEESNVDLKGLILIKEDSLNYRDDYVTIETTNQNSTKSKYGSSFITSIIEEPVIKRFFAKSQNALSMYKNEYVVKCGEVEMILTMPYLIDRASIGDKIELVFKGNDLNLVLIKGIYYEVKSTFKLFG